MSITAKVLIFVIVGIVMLAVTTIGGAMILVFATTLETGTPLPGFGGNLPDLIEHLVRYGATGGLIGAAIGGLLWIVLGFFMFRKEMSPNVSENQDTLES